MSLSMVVIGCGWVSNECHGPAYREYALTHPRLALAACCDADGARAESFRARFGFERAYRDPLEMLERERPDAVCLNVPPEAICALGCEVLRRGLALLSEKPPGLGVAEVDRLIAAADAGGAPHQVAFNRRFMPLAVELKARLGEQAVQHLSVQMARVERGDSNFATTAVHSLDLVRFLAASDFDAASFHYQEMPELGAGVANISLAGTLTNGASAQLSFQPWTGANIERYAVYARDQAFFLDTNSGPDSPGRLRHYRRGRLEADIDAAELCGRRDGYYLNGFYQEDAAFFDALAAGRTPAPGLRAVRQSLELMECITRRRTSYP